MSPPALPRRPRRLARAAKGLLLVSGGLLLLGTLVLAASGRLGTLVERTPMELVRYAEHRLDGHPRLEQIARPLLEAVREGQEREPPAGLPTLGKGQQPFPLVAARFDAAGRPVALAGALPARATAPTRLLVDLPALAAAMATAAPGDVLELAPGSYKLTTTLSTGGAGEPERPIVLRAALPGSVEIVVSAEQAIQVTRPFWVFENLNLRGACARHDDCEHAFHVVGNARGTVIRNNRMSDFNADVKINGEGGAWPDLGLLQFNTITAREGRRTSRPVDVIDLVGASDWQIVDNHVERFVKLADNLVSYGVCVKGGGSGTRIERNLVVCSPERVSMPGMRVGISLGCGGTAAPFCRDGRCETEQADAVVANNVVAHCNDFGIDLHKAGNAMVAHNTLVNSAGIDVRQRSSSAVVAGNLLEGRIRARNDARLDERDNQVVGHLDTLLAAPDALDLRWQELPTALRTGREVDADFCARRRPAASPPGATVQAACDAVPSPP